MFILALFLAFQPPVLEQNQPITVNEILQKMTQHNSWQDQTLIAYNAARRFQAANERFKTSATMDLKTSFRHPDIVESSIVRHEGSDLIRSRVFDKVLEAESETKSQKSKQQVDIRPANYSFTLLGTDSCDGRSCYRLGITPKKKDKYSIEGTVWVDAEDFAIVRIQGKPAKKPSFWTLRTEIDRHYKRIDGLWLPDYMDTWSDILIAGHSTFRIDYKYESIQTPTGVLMP
jgi:hypothetical protein